MPNGKFISHLLVERPLKKRKSTCPRRRDRTFFRTQAAAGTGSGRIFSRFGIWPKYGAGMGKTISILTGSGIWLFPGKRDSPKIGHGMRDLCLRVCRECRKPLKTRVNSKYQLKGSTYILHLLAFVEIRLFNVFFWERKAVFGKLNTWGMRDSREKGAGMRDQDPPFQTLFLVEMSFICMRMKNVFHMKRLSTYPGFDTETRGNLELGAFRSV